jgi:hypothetical protein
LLGFCALLSAFALHHLDPDADAERHRRRRRQKTFAGIDMRGWRPVVASIASFEMLVNAWLALLIFASIDSAVEDEYHGDVCAVSMMNITLRIACFSQAFSAIIVSIGHLIALVYWLSLQLCHLHPHQTHGSCCHWCSLLFGLWGGALSFRRLVPVDSPPASPPVPLPVAVAEVAVVAERLVGAAAVEREIDLDQDDALGAFAAVAAALDAAAAECAVAEDDPV